MDRCLVSVVIPTYNRAQFLGRAVQSVISQSVRCDELIVVDDGSTDNTRDLIRDFKRKNKVDICYISQQNKGPAAARNTGIRHARNEIVAFLDSDDHWQKKKLEYQYQGLVANDTYLVSHTKEHWLRRGEHLNQKIKHLPKHGYIFNQCLELCAVGMSTVMVKKILFDKIGYFNESMRCCEDYDLWIRASCQNNFLLIDKPLTVKEGGRADQVSYQYRVGMDQFRIDSIARLLKEQRLNEEQLTIALREMTRKIKIFSNGCRKHGKENLAESYSSMIPVYNELVTKRRAEFSVI